MAKKRKSRKSPAACLEAKTVAAGGTTFTCCVRKGRGRNAVPRMNCSAPKPVKMTKAQREAWEYQEMAKFAGLDGHRRRRW